MDNLYHVIAEVVDHADVKHPAFVVSSAALIGLLLYVTPYIIRWSRNRDGSILKSLRELPLLKRIRARREQRTTAEETIKVEK